MKTTNRDNYNERLLKRAKKLRFWIDFEEVISSFECHSFFEHQMNDRLIKSRSRKVKKGPAESPKLANKNDNL